MVEQKVNYRDFFRIPFGDHPVVMRIIEVGGRPIVTDPRHSTILDASGGGLCIVSQEDLPIRRGVIAMFEFRLMNQDFRFRGTFVRKVDDLTKFEYGVKFVDVDERQQGMLISVLGRIQVDRHARSVATGV